ncbi:hypothetical protein MMC21_006613 [Puttea exsequens]|nr:hypothetical protein [Puttea exsequens]
MQQFLYRWPTIKSFKYKAHRADRSKGAEFAALAQESAAKTLKTLYMGIDLQEDDKDVAGESMTKALLGFENLNTLHLSFHLLLTRNRRYWITPRLVDILRTSLEEVDIVEDKIITLGSYVSVTGLFVDFTKMKETRLLRFEKITFTEMAGRVPAVYLENMKSSCEMQGSVFERVARNINVSPNRC